MTREEAQKEFDALTSKLGIDTKDIGDVGGRKSLLNMVTGRNKLKTVGDVKKDAEYKKDMKRYKFLGQFLADQPDKETQSP